MAQPRQLCEALSVDSFCAALMEISSQFSSSWGLHRQILGKNCHGGKGLYGALAWNWGDM